MELHWIVMLASMWSIICFVLGYWMRKASMADLQYIVENVVGDTVYNVTGDYIESPLDKTMMSKVFTASSDGE